MKVICIDAKPRDEDYGTEPILSEGSVYTVSETITSAIGKGFIFVYGVLYILDEIGKFAYRADRFVPTSTIDETQFEREYNKEHA